MRWYDLSASGHFGYPQPEDDYQYSTYDSTYCDRCMIRGAQLIPFRFRSEPKARHSQFLQLNWLFDEFFVRVEVIPEIVAAGITGIEFGPALHHRSGRALESIQQMRIQSVLPAGLVTDGLQTVTCKPDNEEGPPSVGIGKLRYPPDYPYCGRVKYHWPKPLRFLRQVFASAPDVVKSFEWFGSGGAANRAILVSERFVETIEKHRWRGLKWTLVEFTD